MKRRCSTDELLSCLKECPSQRCTSQNILHEVLAYEIGLTISRGIAIGNSGTANEPPSAVCQISLTDPEARMRRRDAVQLRAVTTLNRRDGAARDFPVHLGCFECHGIQWFVIGRLSKELRGQTGTVAIDEVDTRTDELARPI